MCLNEILSYMNNIKKENSILTKLLLGNSKLSMQMFGPHSLNEDGTVMPFDMQVAIISHFLHNKGSKFGIPFTQKAKGLIEDFIGKQKEAGNNPDFCVGEDSVQYSLFSELFSVPFLPDESPKFTFIDLFAGIGGFRMAMQNLGGKCVFSSEWDSQAQKHIS